MPSNPLPIKITKSRKCDRCTMRYKVTYTECPHCKDIPDGRELETHIRKHHERLRANGKIGVVFLGVSAVLASILILIAAIK